MMRWTKEEEQVLKEMWKNPAASIADTDKILVSRSMEAIKKKAYALGLGHKNQGAPTIDYEYLKSLTSVVSG
ncbi:MAG: hypothetical protein ACXABF_16450 [Candidatus Thorarchaeota archaeon]|jgi:hypothetical protein